MDKVIDENIQLQQNYANMRKTVQFVNNVIYPIKKNIQNFLKDKHNTKLDPSIDYISQDTDTKQQQQILFSLFKRTVYYFDNIQYDIRDQFWRKAKNILKIDFTQIDFIQKAKLYKNLLHLILEYQVRIQQQQKQLYQQRKQAQRVKKILKQKQQRQKQKDQQQKKKQQKERQEQQQLIDQYDKMFKIVQENFQKKFAQLNKAKTKVTYGISKQRRLQKKFEIAKKKKFSSYNPNIHKPKRPKKPKSY